VLIRERLEALQSKRKVTVFDTYEFFESKDFKNSRDPMRQVVIGNTTLDNRYLESQSGGSLPGGPHGSDIPKPPVFFHGGFQSMDGMHPTAVGYCELAIALMKMLNFGFDKERMRKQALKRETLITKYAAGLNTVITVMHLFQKAPEEAGGPPLKKEPTGDNSDTAHLMDVMKKCVRGR
jgi:hypothetical protein